MIITERFKDISIYDLEGFVDIFIASVERIKTEYSQYSNIQFEVEKEYDYGNEYTVVIYFKGDREETAEEKLKREINSAKGKALREKLKLQKLEKDRKLYESLKKKFENDLS